MHSRTKCLIPNKEWLVSENGTKIGTISKNKKGYSFHCNGKEISLSSNEITIHFGELALENSNSSNNTIKEKHTIYDFPCSGKPFEPVYNIKLKLPLFAKSKKSKSQYCAGYYVIKFRKGWVKSFCPKLITLQRYPYYGPFKTESEMKSVLNTVNKTTYETT